MDDKCFLIEELTSAFKLNRTVVLKISESGTYIAPAPVRLSFHETNSFSIPESLLSQLDWSEIDSQIPIFIDIGKLMSK